MLVDMITTDDILQIRKVLISENTAILSEYLGPSPNPQNCQINPINQDKTQSIS